MSSVATPTDGDDPVDDDPVDAMKGHMFQPGRIRGGTGAAVLVALGLVALVAAQGGYFAESWGWSATGFLWVIGIWLVARGKTDAGKLDVAFLGLLALLGIWIGLSTIWSVNPAATVLEVERALVLISGCAAFLALAHRDIVPRLTLGILTAITLIATYSLATRLLPDRFGTYDPVAVYRLSAPIGYWNGLGVFAVLGILLSLALVVADETSVAGRALAGVSLVVLPSTLFFTYSRAGWVALAFGLAVTIAASNRRLRTIAAATVVAPGAAVGVLIASRTTALTHQQVALTAAAHAGHRLAVVLLVLALGTVGSALAFAAAADRINVGTTARRVVGGSLAVLGALVVAAALVHAGGPATIVRKGYRSFTAPPPRQSANLNSRLLSLSGNGRSELWRYAWKEARAHPVVGTGAGSFERDWQQNPTASLKVRDAHSLYLEALAEIGPVGLALLACALCTPILAGIRRRKNTLVPALLGAYAAFLLHAGVDWDWELAGVTLTALLIGCLLLATSRPDREIALGPRLRYGGVGIAVVLAAGAAAGLLGNLPLGRSHNDTAAGRYDRALTEAVKAERWMPWSPAPWIAKGEAEIALGDREAALVSLNRAAAKDDREWRIWLDIALASRGQARARALAKATSLYPQSAEIADAVATLAANPGR